MTKEECIRLVLDRATPNERAEGLVWYDVANTFAQGLAEKYQLTVTTAVGIIAALSPNVSWESNQIMAENVCQQRKVIGNAYPANISKARSIFYGGDPRDVLYRKKATGKKVRAFFECIENPHSTSSVCIDRHAFDIANGSVSDDRERSNTLRRVGVYESYRDAYQNVANDVGLAPCQVQAITWVVWRNMKKVLGLS